MSRCERCDSREANIHFDLEGTSLYICHDCYSEIMAEEMDVQLEEVAQSFSVKDFQGVERTFHVERRIHPNGIYMEAAESIELGYKFAVDGELDCNQQDLLQKLMKKARKGTGLQQVEAKVYPDGRAYNTMIHDQITGFLEYDQTSEDTPLVIIDGKPYTWEEVGKMLTTYEGFQIKIKTYEPSDDVE
ncbi:hypothetical protein [Bacillus sp. FJAT-27251]|uniref:DUF7686 domain-containing protein n=1 Tax=Bacillus sp. FJAT-27251 TaxID=1684142 RepID=UPI0006A7BC26|nr:hypothetical protein [Bacillus sp. FJAT-27251]